MLNRHSRFIDQQQNTDLWREEESKKSVFGENWREGKEPKKSD